MTYWRDKWPSEKFIKSYNWNSRKRRVIMRRLQRQDHRVLGAARVSAREALITTVQICLQNRVKMTKTSWKVRNSCLTWKHPRLVHGLKKLNSGKRSIWYSWRANKDFNTHLVWLETTCYWKTLLWHWPTLTRKCVADMSSLRILWHQDPERQVCTTSRTDICHSLRWKEKPHKNLAKKRFSRSSHSIRWTKTLKRVKQSLYSIVIWKRIPVKANKIAMKEVWNLWDLSTEAPINTKRDLLWPWSSIKCQNFRENLAKLRPVRHQNYPLRRLRRWDLDASRKIPTAWALSI